MLEMLNLVDKDFKAAICLYSENKNESFKECVLSR